VSRIEMTNTDFMNFWMSNETAPMILFKLCNIFQTPINMY